MAKTPEEHNCPECGRWHSILSISSATPAPNADILMSHWPLIECDHENKRDRANCSCSKVDLGWHPSVGEAVKSWVTHVAQFFRAASLKQETQPPKSQLGYDCMLSVLNRIGEIVGIKNDYSKFSGDELVAAIKKLASSSPLETPAALERNEK